MKNPTQDDKTRSMTPFEKMEVFFDSVSFKTLFHKRMKDQYGDKVPDLKIPVIRVENIRKFRLYKPKSDVTSNKEDITRTSHIKAVTVKSKSARARSKSVVGSSGITKDSGHFVLKADKKTTTKKQNLSKA